MKKHVGDVTTVSENHLGNGEKDRKRIGSSMMTRSNVLKNGRKQQRVAYGFIIFLLQFILPLVSSMFVYIKVVKTLQRRSRLRLKNTKSQAKRKKEISCCFARLGDRKKYWLFCLCGLCSWCSRTLWSGLHWTRCWLCHCWGAALVRAPVASAPAVADEDNILFCLMFELDMQDFLYQVGLVNEKQGDECLEMETTTQGLIQHCALWLQPCGGQLWGVHHVYYYSLIRSDQGKLCKEYCWITTDRRRSNDYY